MASSNGACRQREGRSGTASVPTSTPATSHIVLAHNHHLGDHSDDILALQNFLNTHGFTIAPSGPGSPEHETPVFGLKTFQALKKFQQAHDLPATGYLGPLTRALIQSF
jgi:peptidoglycan hydrolase-like protein with peptidoglycan-binding domain